MLLSVVPVNAQLSFDELASLPPLPDEIFDLTDEERMRWLEAEINKTASTLEAYRLSRQLFYEYYWTEQTEQAKLQCVNTPPLREDYYYRENCVDVTYLDYKSYLPQMLELVHEVRQTDNDGLAAEFLKDLAWRQSQYGDISGTYQSYETALAIAPADDVILLSTIMLDTATNYIVHGDESYVNKGIKLLKKTREQSASALLTEEDPELRDILEDNITLTHFNTGIAYMLHLYDYSKALNSFEQVHQNANAYEISSLSFSALAAAELSKIDRAKAYIQRLSGRQDSQKDVELYLNCYRQLAMRHWNGEQSLTSCLNLNPETTIEVQLDVYKRLAELDDDSIRLLGLEKLKNLFITKMEPQLKNHGTQAASNTELKRLQRESELKSLVLKQQEQLQQERELAHSNRQKFFLASFAVLVSFILLVISQLKQKKKLAEQYHRMSTRDSLTQLGNRRYLEQQMNREFAYLHRAMRTNEDAALGIYLFDIDHFKHINDTFGHQAGDEVLQELSRRISRATRDTDLLIRWGGEEFVYIARLDTKERTYQLATRILNAINSELFEVSQCAPIRVTCTIGVVKFPFIDTENLNLWTRLINLADAALYYGKKKQRNCWVVINNENLTDKEQIDELLKHPIEKAAEKGLISIRTSDESG
jgi:diguanylate cyclase (GGDEF)-like protein